MNVTLVYEDGARRSASWPAPAGELTDVMLDTHIDAETDVTYLAMYVMGDKGWEDVWSVHADGLARTVAEWCDIEAANGLVRLDVDGETIWPPEGTTASVVGAMAALADAIGTLPE